MREWMGEWRGDGMTKSDKKRKKKTKRIGGCGGKEKKRSGVRKGEEVEWE